MKKIFPVRFFLALLACCVLVPSANATLTSVPVSVPNAAYGYAYNAEYEFRSVSLFIDPAATNWIAWSDSFGTPPTSADPYACATGSCIGRHGFGTNDHIRLTVTNPLGAAFASDIDWNDGSGNSSGPQMILFGTAANAPDVRRYNFFTLSYYLIDEAGAFNAAFTSAGTYRFDFSFRNAWGFEAGHENVYLLVDVNPIPEPETYALMLAGLGMLGFAARRRREKAVQA